MNKGELKNVQQMVDSLTHRIWKVECLGHVLQNTLSGGELVHKIEYNILAEILNENIRKTEQKLDKLDRHLMLLNNKS